MAIKERGTLPIIQQRILRMKSLRCRDLGIDCDFVTSSETDQAVVTIMFAHSVEHHPETHDYMFADKATALVGDMEGAISCPGLRRLD